MSTKTKPKVSKTAKTKVGSKAKATKGTKANAAKPAAAAKGNRHEKREKALALRKKGKTYKEIMVACGFANAGAACNAVKRAQAAEGAASK